MFSSNDIDIFHPKILPPTVLWKSSMKNYSKKDKSRNMNIDINNQEVGQYNHQSLLRSIEDNTSIFPFSQQPKEEAVNKNKDAGFKRLLTLVNKETDDKSKTMVVFGKNRRHSKVILEDGREFFQGEEEEEEEMDKKKVIFRRKVTTSYGSNQQRLQQKRQREILQKIHLTGGKQTSIHHGSSYLLPPHQQREAHHRHFNPIKSNNHKEHQQFFVAKSLLGQPQQQFQERVQRRQAALFLYRRWQLQVRQEFEDLERIHQNIISSDSRSTMKKKGNMAVRPIRVGFQKIARRPSIIRERKKGEVKTSELRRYLNLLEKTDIVSSFLERDSCYRLSDKYLLAGAFVYFKRAGYPLEKYTPRHFFVALYLANDMEEDEEDLKYEIFPWAIGNDWQNRIQEFLKERDRLFQDVGQRGVVSRACCEEIMAIIPNSKCWLRNRLLHHAGGVRNSKILINPPIEYYSTSNNNNSNNNTPQMNLHNSNGTGSYLNYCGIVEPVQPFILAPDIAPIPCFLCHPELAQTPPKNCPPLSLVLRQNPTIQGQSEQRDLQNTKVVRCCFNSSLRSDYSDLSSSSSDEEEDNDDELSFSSETSSSALD